MANGSVQVQPDSTGKKVQTFENTVSANLVEAQAVVIVDTTGVAIATQPVSVASLPLPTGAAIEAGHIATIDGKVPALGQALAAASVPVVLTSIQQTALTPPAAITGFALEAGHLATLDSHLPAQGQALAAASLPVVLTAIQQTALTPPAAISGFALEAGHLATIDTSTAKIPAQGQALAAASLPVVLTAIQQTALTPPAAITGFALEAGHLSSLDTKLPAQGQALAAASVPVVLTAIQLTALTPLTTVTVTPPTLTKGTQGATGFSTQNLVDAGRANIMWTAEFSPAAVAEALLTVTESRDGAAVTTFTTKVVTSGKRMRITSLSMVVENTLGVNPKRAKLRMRFNTSAAVTTASPLQGTWAASVATAVNTVGASMLEDFPDGIEYLGDGTKQIGFTLEFPDWVTAAQTGKVYITIFAFEY